MPTAHRAIVGVHGVVQGVGFRPFVARRARAHDLAGTVRNRGDAGVKIVLEGPENAIDGFLDDLQASPPPLSRVESVTVDREPAAQAAPLDAPAQFRILESTRNEGGTGTVPPDTGLCAACLADLRDPDSRYAGYWATSCVDCGPRYTVIRELPYDRPRTAMDAFPLCADCRAEYEDPTDRRYHAQTIACPDCGPTLSLQVRTGDGRRREGTGTAALDAARERLLDGQLLALRGIGGTHLACDATNPEAVARLRSRTGRPSKPFAVMAPSLDRVREFATVSAAEAAQLEDVRRPIVVLERAGDRLQGVAPGLHTVGTMLPSAGLHHLLFEAGPGNDGTIEAPLVMTSANVPGEPMCTTVDGIFRDLGSVIDAALVHDREIVARCDDSVVRIVDDDRRFLRRSRGWVPQPLPRPDPGPPILAVGAEFDGTVALAREDEVIPSQHLGDVDGPATEAFLRDTVDHLTTLLGVTPEAVACDAHPQFLTSQFAREYADSTPIAVQHHHAHAASLLAEHDRERAIVIVADGTGYGPDGTIWGGEVLDASREDYSRIGGLSTFRLPGGEAAIEQPGRILASLLDEERAAALVAEHTSLERDDVATLQESLDAEVNAPATTSAGRFLDAISAMLGLCTRRDYEGQPAIELESAASRAAPARIDLSIGRRGGRRVLDVKALAQALDALEEPADVVAATAQDALARGLATVAIEEATDRGIDAVGFSGGVALNDAISRRIRSAVEAAGLDALQHEQVPPGDAGLSYGQAVVAAANLDGGPP